MSALNRSVGWRGPAGWRPGRGGVIRRLHRDDHGAVATIFGILLAGGVLLGMLALVVDVGQLYAEREELQTGADAAATAIAKSCAADISTCTDVNRANAASQYADANAKDNAANFTICGSVSGVSDLVPCDSLPQSNNLTSCVGNAPPAPQPYVEVHTTTALPDGSTLLPPSFAQALLGNGSYQGTEVGACARVAWGAPKAGLAVTFSLCEWNEATNNGTDFPEPPPYPPNSVPDPSYEIVLKLHDSQGNPSCPAGPPGSDQPGGFGWLDDGTTADCNTDTFTADTGNNVSAACLDVLDPITDSSATAKVLYIPIYSEVTGTGSNAVYTITGMAAFVPTGYFFSNGASDPPTKKTSWLTGLDHCSGQERCIYGYFVDVLQPGPVDIGGGLENLGATVISLIG